MEIRPYVAQGPVREETDSLQVATAGADAFGQAASAVGQWAAKVHDAEVQVETSSALLTAQDALNEWFGSLNPEARFVETRDGTRLDRTESLQKEYRQLTAQITEQTLEGMTNRRAKQLARAGLAELYAKNTLEVAKVQRDLKIGVLRDQLESKIETQVTKYADYETAKNLLKIGWEQGLYSQEEYETRSEELSKEADRMTFVNEYTRILEERSVTGAARLQASVANPENYQHLSADERMALADATFGMRERVESAILEDQKETWDQNYATMVAGIEGMTIARFWKAQEDGDISPDQAVSGIALLRSGSTTTNDAAFARDMRVRIAQAMRGPDVRDSQGMLKDMLIRNAERLSPGEFQSQLDEIESMDDQRLRDPRYQGLLDRYASKLQAVRPTWGGFGKIGQWEESMARQEAYSQFERDLREVYLETNSVREANDWASKNWESYEPADDAPAAAGARAGSIEQANEWLSGGRSGYTLDDYTRDIERLESSAGE